MAFIFVFLPFYLDESALEKGNNQLTSVEIIDVERINQLSKNVTFLLEKLVSNTILSVAVNMSQNFLPLIISFIFQNISYLLIIKNYTK